MGCTGAGAVKLLVGPLRPQGAADFGERLQRRGQCRGGSLPSPSPALQLTEQHQSAGAFARHRQTPMVLEGLFGVALCLFQVA